MAYKLPRRSKRTSMEPCLAALSPSQLMPPLPGDIPSIFLTSVFGMMTFILPLETLSLFLGLSLLHTSFLGSLHFINNWSLHDNGTIPHFYHFERNTNPQPSVQYASSSRSGGIEVTPFERWDRRRKVWVARETSRKIERDRERETESTATAYFPLTF